MATEEQSGKRITGKGEQPFRTPAVVFGCTRTANTVGSVTLWVDAGMRRKMKFLLDTGSDLCLCKHSSLREGTIYSPTKSVKVKGISNVIERTLGEIVLKLSTHNHETEHPFQIVGDAINIPCDGIIGRFSRKQESKDRIWT
jgi:hypothetical protein